MEYPFKSAMALNQPPTWLHLELEAKNAAQDLSAGLDSAKPIQCSSTKPETK